MTKKKKFYGRSVADMVQGIPPVPEVKKVRVVDSNFDLGGVRYVMHTNDGKLKSLNMQFVGGSAIQFYVEE